jgi:phage baseplate assembly protein W
MGYFVTGNTNNDNEDTILGTSLTFQQGNGGFSTNVTTVTQGYENLKHLLLTRVGEVYQSNFGSDLLKLVFSSNMHVEGDLKMNVSDVINDAVSKWATYIKIIDIVTNFDETNYTLDINISFSIDTIKHKI